VSDAQPAGRTISRRDLRLLIFVSGVLGGLVVGILYVLLSVLPMVAQIRTAHPNYYDPTGVIVSAFVFASVQGALYGLASSLGACLIAAMAVRVRSTANLEVLATFLGAIAGLAAIYLVLPPALDSFRLGFVAIAGVVGALWFAYLTTLYRRAKSRSRSVL
jgi:hypothetical protein